MTLFVDKILYAARKIIGLRFVLFRGVFLRL